MNESQLLKDRHLKAPRQFARYRKVLPTRPLDCLLYTSDAADDLLCVDLGGRRIIKKKTKTNQTKK